MNDWEHEFMKEPEPLSPEYTYHETWKELRSKLEELNELKDQKLKDLRQEVATLKLALETANQMRDAWEEKHRKLKEDVGALLLLLSTHDIHSEDQPAIDHLRSTLNEG